jgi:hypothetical protein
MPLVGAGNGLQHLGMNASVVIAGKTADRFHGINNVAEAKCRFTSEAIAALPEVLDLCAGEVRRIVAITFLALPSLTVTVWNSVLFGWFAGI